MKINLLTWRDTDRKQKLTQFSRIFLLSIVCGGCVWMIIYIVFDKKLQHFSQENRQILQKIANQTESLLQFRQTKNQQQQQENFFQQAKLIRLKQQQVLLFFVNLPQLMSGTLYLTNVKKEDKQIAIVGLANDYQDIYRLLSGIQRQVGQVRLGKVHKLNQQITFEINTLFQ